MQKFPFPTFRKIIVGGKTKDELFQALSDAKINLNIYAMRLLTHEAFSTSAKKSEYSIVKVTVKDLGFANGATIDQIYKKAKDFDLELCPADLAPYLRLQYLDQPAGSVSVAMKKLTREKNVPDAFYLRKMKGLLWLRAYWLRDSKSESSFVFDVKSQFFFVKRKSE